MRLKKIKRVVSEFPLLRELLWKDRYIESGINVMITTKTNYYILEKSKRRLDDFDGSGYSLIENFVEDEFF